MYSHSMTSYTNVETKPRSETRPCLSKYRNPDNITLISLIDELRQHVGVSSWPAPVIKLTTSEEADLTISGNYNRKINAFFEFIKRDDAVAILSVNENAKKCIVELLNHTDLPHHAKSLCRGLLQACRNLSTNNQFTADVNKYQLAKTEELINNMMIQIEKIQQVANRKSRVKKKNRPGDLSKQSSNSSNSSASSSSQFSLFAPQVTQSEGIIQAKIETDSCVKTRKRSLSI